MKPKNCKLHKRTAKVITYKCLLMYSVKSQDTISNKYYAHKTGVASGALADESRNYIF